MVISINKKQSVYLLIGFFIIFFINMLHVYAKDFVFKKEYMSMSQVKKRWGAGKFIPAQFKKNEEPIFRAKMAYQLIKSKRYIGQTIEAVRQELGISTGYFFNDVIPTYIIESRKKKNNRFVGETWQLVFLLTKDGHKIEEVKVHKQCCYKYDEKFLKEIDKLLQ